MWCGLGVGSGRISLSSNHPKSSQWLLIRRWMWPCKTAPVVFMTPLTRTEFSSRVAVQLRFCCGIRVGTRSQATFTGHGLVSLTTVIVGRLPQTLYTCLEWLDIGELIHYTQDYDSLIEHASPQGICA